MVMKSMALQLVTVGLENGQHGVFVGWPLVNESIEEIQCQVESIWFSDVQQVPHEMTVAQLMELVRKQLCACLSTVQ
jgi:hypothetical protein